MKTSRSRWSLGAALVLRSHAAAAVALAFALVLLGGCKSAIGDSCSNSTDCSVNGDRLCDTAQNGGYCTVFNCEPGSCPEGEAVCVSFNETVCGSRERGARFGRTFCMKPCSSPGDCRAGYECRPVGDQVIDNDPPSRSICIAPASVTPSTPMDEPTATVCDSGLPGEFMYPDVAVSSGDAAPDGDAATDEDVAASADAETSVDGADDGAETAAPDADSSDAPIDGVSSDAAASGG